MVTCQLVRFLDDRVGIVKYNDLVTTDGTDAGLQLA